MKINKKWLWITIGLGAVTAIVMYGLSFGLRAVTVPFLSQPMTVSESEVPTLGIDGNSGMISKGTALPMMDQTVTNHSTVMMPPYYPQDDALNVDQRVHAKSSSDSLVADNVSQYMQQLEAYVISIGGRVLNSSLSTNPKATYGFLRIKVPVDKFEATNQKVTAEASEVIAQSVNAEDETGQAVAVDTQIQDLQTKKLAKQVELTKAKTDAEKKALELQITQLDNQINALTKTQNVQKQTTDYATVTVQAANKKAYFMPVVSGEGSLRDEIALAWQSMRGILMFAARLVIWAAIYALLWLPIVLLVGFVVSRIKRHQTPTI
jgi:hypothetical protein